MDIEATPAGPSQEPRFYVGQGEQTTGPYPRSEIESLFQSGAFTDGHFVWDESTQRWLPLPEFLGLSAVDQSVSSDSARHVYPCHAHSDRAAMGNCEDCHKLICLSCIQIKSGEVYCSDCGVSVQDKSSNPLQEHLEKTLGVFYQQPIYGVAAVFLIAFFLMPSPKKLHAQKTEGIGRQESSSLWRQAQRALLVAHAFSDHGEPARAKKWFELSMSSAEHLVDDRSVSSLIREQSLMFQMRIALDLEQYERLNQLLMDVETKIDRPMRDADRIFFKACRSYLFEKNASKAIELFQQLTGGHGPSFQSIDMMIEVMSKPYQTDENVKRLTGESYTSAEVFYRMGLCYELDGKADKARDVWYRVYKQTDATGAANRWRRLAMKKIENKEN